MKDGFEVKTRNAKGTYKISTIRGPEVEPRLEAFENLLNMQPPFWGTKQEGKRMDNRKSETSGKGLVEVGINLGWDQSQ